MKNLFILIFITLLSVSFYSCGDPDSGSEGVGTEQSDSKHLGFWYTSIDNEVYSLYLDKNGSAIVKVYTWENKEWSEQEKKASYTLNTSNGDFILKFADNSTATGNIMVTGNNMSVKNGDTITMLTKYSGAKSDLSAVFKDIEDNWLDVTPGTITDESTIWDTPEAVEQAINALFASARDYIRYQLFIEKYVIDYKKNNGEHSHLDPYDAHFDNLWEKGYRAIHYSNLIIENTASKRQFETSYKEAVAMRAFLYYNIAMLWGNIPYVTKSFSLDEGMNANNAPQLDANTVYGNLLNDINFNLSEIRGYDVYFTRESLSYLINEIQMARLGKCILDVPYYEGDIFRFADASDGMGELMGINTPIYNGDYYNLLNMEINKSEDLLSAWNRLGDYRYGYWAMLKRTGKTAEVANIQGDELLLPIPSPELNKVSYLKQNPGY